MAAISSAPRPRAESSKGSRPRLWVPRMLLTLALLVAAVASGWSVWTHRPERRTTPVAEARSDYTLHDFELVVLDNQGKESFTLRAPELTRNPGDRSMALATPLSACLS